jgi:hypothetical protein
MPETESDHLHRLKDQIPTRPKNDIVRSRGEYPGEAGADWSYGATAKPEADEHRHSTEGLRGDDKRQADLRDQSSNLREPRQGDPAETRDSPHQAAQHGADVRGNPPMVQGSSREDSLPEGLRRPRKGPYDRRFGRNQAATQVPNSDPRKN